MSNLGIPFNVSILELTKDKLQGLKPVRSGDIFDGSGQNLHEDGLFSPSIFGRVGDEIRDYRYSYIDLGIEIFHPILFKVLGRLKSLYEGIMSGKEYGIWNEELKDFERATALNGQTGYHFFVTHWKDIQFNRTKSDMREQMIQLIDKFKDVAMTDKIIVMPAGLRDVEVDDNGRPEEHEINPLYRKMLAISNVVTEASVKLNPEVLNAARYSLQTTFNEIYDLLERMIEGKKKLILGKWASRKIFNGTRNVITAMDTSVAYLGKEGNVGFNNSLIGLYQCMKAMLPVARFHLKNGFLSKVFISKDLPVKLVDKKTLHTEDVTVKPEYFDRWTSDDGLEKVIDGFKEESLRHQPIEVNGRYLGLIYKGPDGTFKLLQDIDEVPEGRSREDVSPLTFCELLYLSIYHVANKYPIFVTRYPVTGIGSIYPSKVYLKTTTQSEVRRELNDAWEPMGEDRVAYEFPMTGPFMNSLVPHVSRLAGLLADFDGDTSSGNITYSDEAVKEVDEYLTKKRAYVNTDGTFLSSTNVDTIALVLYNLTGD